MIEVKYTCSSNNRAISMCRNIGFQLLLRRHGRKMSIQLLSKKIGFPLNEIDDVELGKKHAKFDTMLAMACYFNFNFDKIEMEKAFRLR